MVLNSPAGEREPCSSGIAGKATVTDRPPSGLGFPQPLPRLRPIKDVEVGEQDFGASVVGGRGQQVLDVLKPAKSGQSDLPVPVPGLADERDGCAGRPRQRSPRESKDARLMAGLVLPARDHGLPDRADRESGLVVGVAGYPFGRECLEVSTENLRRLWPTLDESSTRQHAQLVPSDVAGRPSNSLIFVGEDSPAATTASTELYVAVSRIRGSSWTTGLMIRMSSETRARRGRLHLWRGILPRR